MVHSVRLESECASAHVGSNPTSSAVEDSRFIKVTAYFLVLALLVEYVGLRLDHWNFPGLHYIWKINYLGHHIPIEELLFYFILSTPGILSYYEFLDDDRR